MTNEFNFLVYSTPDRDVKVIIHNDKEFVRLVKEIFEKDKFRGDKERNILLNDFIKQTINKLENDELYKKEYNTFVYTMCYGDTNISFNDAMKSYKALCEIVINN